VQPYVENGLKRLMEVHQVSLGLQPGRDRHGPGPAHHHGRTSAGALHTLGRVLRQRPVRRYEETSRSGLNLVAVGIPRRQGTHDGPGDDARRSIHGLYVCLVAGARISGRELAPADSLVVFLSGNLEYGLVTQTPVAR
jgi:hypothetical protein